MEAAHTVDDLHRGPGALLPANRQNVSSAKLADASQRISDVTSRNHLLDPVLNRELFERFLYELAGCTRHSRPGHRRRNGLRPDYLFDHRNRLKRSLNQNHWL